MLICRVRHLKFLLNEFGSFRNKISEMQFLSIFLQAGEKSYGKFSAPRPYRDYDIDLFFLPARLGDPPHPGADQKLIFINSHLDRSALGTCARDRSDSHSVLPERSS